MSTIQPSIGVSQVSSAMKIVNASWIAARASKRHPRKSNPQALCASRIGLTNSVQPYCRLAIITMQKMTATSWLHLVALSVRVPAPTVLATVMFPSPRQWSSAAAICGQFIVCLVRAPDGGLTSCACAAQLRDGPRCSAASNCSPPCCVATSTARRSKSKNDLGFVWYQANPPGPVGRTRTESVFHESRHSG